MPSVRSGKLSALLMHMVCEAHFPEQKHHRDVYLPRITCTDLLFLWVL